MQINNNKNPTTGWLRVERMEESNAKGPRGGGKGRFGSVRDNDCEYILYGEKKKEEEVQNPSSLANCDVCFMQSPLLGRRARVCVCVFDG